MFSTSIQLEQLEICRVSWLTARRAADELLESVRRRALEATCALLVGDAGYAVT